MIDDFRPVRSSEPPKELRKQIRPRMLKKDAEPVFRTPEEVAANESDTVTDTPKPKIFDVPEGLQSKQHRFRFSLHWPPSKRELIVSAVVILLIVSGIASWLLTRHSAPPVAAEPKKAVVKKPAVPTTVPSTLSGLPVDPTVNQRPVTGVMIENSLDARPQSGLSQAGVVFEAVAEGGVTRFLALFQDTQPGNFGPIRSARPYYVSWALGFDAGYAHVGGSPDGLQDIKDWGVRDLDQFYNSGSYHRVSNRVAPHNVYTSLDALTQLEASKGYTSSKFTGFSRKKETKPAQATVTSIDFSLSGPLYNPHYDYDAAANAYKRSEDGAPHTDAETSAQIEPKVVIALVVPLSQGELDSSGAYYSDYNVLGSGTAYIFQDGTVATATWNKPDNGSSLTFTDASGKPFGLNPGQTWITAVSDTSKVSYH